MALFLSERWPVVDIRSTGSKMMPFLADIPGGLNDDDNDMDVDLGFG